MIPRRAIILQNLQLERTPGITAPFTIAAQPGINLIVGPNEIGKSSLVRAVLTLLWSAGKCPAPLNVGATWRDDQGELQARRDDLGPAIWTRNDQAIPAPDLPAGHIARCYHLGLLDLNHPAGSDLDQTLASEIHRQMSGGFDLTAARELFPDTYRKTKAREKAWQDANQALGKCQREQKSWFEEEGELTALKTQLEAARVAAKQITVLANEHRRRELTQEIADRQERLDALPAGVSRTYDIDNKTVLDHFDQIRKYETQVAILAQEIEVAITEITELNQVGDLAELAAVIQQSEYSARQAVNCANTLAATASRVRDAAQQLPPALQTESATAADPMALTTLAKLHWDTTTIQARINAATDVLELIITPTAHRSSWELAALSGVGWCAFIYLIFVRHDPLAAGVAGLFGLASALIWWRQRRTQSQPDDQLSHQIWQQRLKKAVDEQKERQKQRRAFLSAHNLDPKRHDPDLLNEIDTVQRWRQAASELAGDQGRTTAADQALNEDLNRAVAILKSLGISRDANLAAVKAGLEQARERQARLTAAQTAKDTATKNLDRDTRELTRQRELLAAVQERLATPEGEDLLAHVRMCVDALPAHGQLTQELASLKRELNQVTNQIATDAPTIGLTSLASFTDEALASTQTKARNSAERGDDLLASIVKIEERVDAAGRGNALANAAAGADEAEAAYLEILANAQAAALGRVFLDAVLARHELDAQPPLLVAMNEHLSRFTVGRYQVRVTNAESGEQHFVAVTNSGQLRTLSELSDGTRAQLLLAARLAFLTTAEQGLQAPLFLDEALTGCDPQRFSAIAGALGHLAAETGRQVFYLTSNPNDIASWQASLSQHQLVAAHVIDLNVQRGQQSSAPFAALQPVTIAPIPAPGSRPAAEYGQILMVPPLQPWDHAHSVHLFHLLSKDLDLLHVVLVSGATTLGQWLRLQSDLLRAGVINQEQATHIDLQGTMWDAFLSAWQVGRGRPVTPEALRESQSFSTKMLPEALNLLQELAGDGKSLMDAVTAGRIKNLRQPRKEKLEDYLIQGGHLDRRPTQSPADIVGRVLGTLSAALGDGTANPEGVREIVLGWGERLGCVAR